MILLDTFKRRLNVVGGNGMEMGKLITIGTA